MMSHMFAGLLALDRGQKAQTIHLVSQADFDDFHAGLGEVARAAVAAAGFRGRADSSVFLPGNGADWGLAVGLGAESSAPGRWTLATAAAALPEGVYRLDGPLSAVAAHGWLMAQHRFTRYHKPSDMRGPRTLLMQDGAMMERAIAEAAATAGLRDMIDTPAEDMGPDAIEAMARTLGEQHDARVTVVAGEALLEQNYPAIYAVGRASPRRPRVIMLDWGNDSRQPLVALVGKGVCFDTGGLNLKPGGAMGLMKKDMGGAAHALALAALMMERRLPVRLKLVIGAVDNAVAGNAMRPGDILSTRKGISVEVGNTDAEGRLVLADALARATEDAPALLLDFATLTGAARVALGPDLPALFTNDDALATELAAAAVTAEDPLWRLPLWRPYATMLRSTIADINNNAEGGMAGAIAAALFLERFVPDGVPWAHLDLYAWNNTARAGRPKGGAALGLFATLGFLEQRFSPCAR